MTSAPAGGHIHLDLSVRLESGYQELLFLQKDQTVAESILALLRKNHGVGIIGGYYDDGPPICLISELAVRMLGYESSVEFEAATDCSMSALLCQSKLSSEHLVSLSSAEETHLHARNNSLWVRIMKRDIVDQGRKMWLISICDMSTLYQKDLLVNELIFEKRRQKLMQQKQLRKANFLLEQCQEIIAHQAEEKEISFTIVNEVKKEDCALISSSTHLRQILTTLLSNAVRYNKPGGSITVTAETESADEATVTVKFTASGTGLGLPIVK